MERAYETLSEKVSALRYTHQLHRTLRSRLAGAARP